MLTDHEHRDPEADLGEEGLILVEAPETLDESTHLFENLTP